MIFPYIIIGFTFTISGLLFWFFPNRTKKIMLLVMNKELFYIPGIIEIIMGLTTLWFRDNTSMTWFSYLMGFLLFFDGIFNLAAPNGAKMGYEYFLQDELKGFKTYGIFLFSLSIGYLLAGFSL